TTQWRTIFRQLIALGYINVDAERHGALKLTEKCRAVLRGEQSLELRAQSKEEKLVKESKKKSPVRPQDEPLWEALRALRMQLADEGGVPPYVIFHDATLQEMVKKRPNSTADLRYISGVGDQKIKRYGKVFLAEIAKYPLAELLNNRLSATVNETLLLYQDGKSIDEISKERDIKANTIYGHLADAIEVGLLDVFDVLELEKSQYEEIVMMIESLEDESKGRLKAIYEALDEEYEYGVIKCVQASM
ncbi:MAG: HRDC domain-containing protein, partial [Cycloclasticus sp.]|nr:HRDC domain-containing protein [Cycloclasticus sp.]